jgi:MFS family permease
VAGERLPEGTRVAIIFGCVVAGICTLGALVLAILAALDPDTKRPGLAILLTLAPFALILAVMGLAGWLVVRRIRRNPDLRRRQLNGRAQATMLTGFLLAYTLGNVASAVLGVDGWAQTLVVVAVALIAYLPVIMLAKRFDPRLHWFRRPDPLSPEEEEGQARREAARRTDGPW